MISPRHLLACGMAMPFVYFLALGLAVACNPGFDLLHEAPSGLGGPEAAWPWVYNLGMVATAAVGLAAAAGLAAARPGRRRSLPCIGAGASLLAASVGIGMAGIFPLPSALHDGFGLIAAAALTPLFGAVAIWRTGDPIGAGVLAVWFVGIATLLPTAATPLVPGAIMLAAVAHLSAALRGRNRAG